MVALTAAWMGKMMGASVVAARVDLMVALTERKMVVLKVAWMDGLIAASKG